MKSHQDEVDKKIKENREKYGRLDAGKHFSKLSELIETMEDHDKALNLLKNALNAYMNHHENKINQLEKTTILKEAERHRLIRARQKMNVAFDIYTKLENGNLDLEKIPSIDILSEGSSGKSMTNLSGDNLLKAIKIYQIKVANNQFKPVEMKKEQSRSHRP